MKKAPSKYAQGENYGSAVPPEFPHKRALNSCNGLTRTALLKLSGDLLRGDHPHQLLYTRTKHVLSERKPGAEPPHPCICTDKLTHFVHFVNQEKIIYLKKY